MPLYEPVMQYHVKNSEDEEDDEGEDEEEDEDGKYLMSSVHRKKSFSNRAAAEELDGNLPPRYRNPLTIIQIKNPNKNVDSSDVDFIPSGVPRFVLLALIFALGTLVLGLLIWNVPCSSCSSVYSSSEKDPYLEAVRSNRDWSVTFKDIVLTSGLEEATSSILISGYRENATSSGLIGFSPSSGAILWKLPLPSHPTKHGCRLLDVNSDGRKDCVISGEDGLLAAIDPIRGTGLWYTRHHIPLTNLSLPRKLPDLNGDGVPELLSACAVTLPSGVKDHRRHLRNNLVLLSGKTGKVIGRPYRIEECTDLGAVNLTSKLAIQFDCTSSIGPDEFEMSLEEFYLKTTRKELSRKVSEVIERRGSEYYQFESVGLDSPETIRDSIHLDVSSLKPECPECGVIVKIWDGFAHRVLWSQTWRNAVAFQPLSTRYETERWDSPIEGFIFRLWEWEAPSDTFKKRGYRGKEKEFYFYSVRESQADDDEFVVRVLNVTESIYYATLNHTHPELMSIFSQKIRQKCVKSFRDDKFECTPHFNSHPNSMVILENDSRKEVRELIMASHTIIRDPDWKIRTTLRKKSLRKDILQMKKDF